MIFIVKVGFTLLRIARRDLLGLDFEGVLKYLRVTLPKRFVDPEAGNELLATALAAKVTPSKLNKYGKEWRALRAAQLESESPIQALERQVASLRNQVNHLERENEALASVLITSKTSMHNQVDRLEDKAEVLTRELFTSRQDLQDTLEEKRHLESEVTQVKQMLRKALADAARERNRMQNLLGAYKAIVFDLNRRCNQSQRPAQEEEHQQKTDDGDQCSEHIFTSPNDSEAFYIRLLSVLLPQVSNCETCSPALELSLAEWNQQASVTSSYDTDNINEMPDEFHLNSGSNTPSRDELPEVVSEAISHTFSTESSRQSPATTRSAAMSYLKPKQWFTQTLNTLRAMANTETSNPTTESRKNSNPVPDIRNLSQPSGV